MAGDTRGTGPGGAPFGAEADAPIIDADCLVQPGGKVDPDRLREAIESARAGGGAMPRVQFTLQRDLNEPRLDKYLTSRVTFLSRSQLQTLIDSGGATVGGAPAKRSAKLRRGDVVRLVIPPPPSSEILPQEIDIEVLFEDEHLIVLNKHDGILVHPGRSEPDGTLINALAWRFAHVSGGALSGVGREDARPGVVHRLDRHTTGCIVFAKTDQAHWKLGAQFERRTADKRYLAVVHASVEPDTQTIDRPIGPHPSKVKGFRERQVVRYDDLGKPSVTVCRVRERYRLHTRSVGDQAFSLVELELKTGRTHQIRVHMADAGWALVGDDMYGGIAYGDSKGFAFARPALHAALLAIEHPMTGEPLVFTASPPDDLLGLVASLRGSGVTEHVDAPGTVPLRRLGFAGSTPGDAG
ncbi:MAG: RluA family pseudouridine synthase [Planctomycetota bacterium]